MIEALNDYLNLNAFANPYSKGLSLFVDGKVEKTEFNPLTGLGSAIVQGCRKYFVPLSYDLKKKKIETNCTCLTDWLMINSLTNSIL
jgi:uncharacterized Zn finger protein